jgi:hypothetical protein
MEVQLSQETNRVVQYNAEKPMQQDDNEQRLRSESNDAPDKRADH